MDKTSFNTGWVVQPRVGPFEELAGDAPAKIPVTLPHDAMLGSGRSASSPQGSAGARLVTKWPGPLLREWPCARAIGASTIEP